MLLNSSSSFLWSGWVNPVDEPASPADDAAALDAGLFLDLDHGRDFLVGGAPETVSLKPLGGDRFHAIRAGHIAREHDLDVDDRV
jgi:hypothetical protein